MSRKSLNNLNRQKNSEFTDIADGFSGFQALTEVLEKYIKNTENVTEVFEIGAKDFVNDLKKLPRPISKIRKAGYTHLIDSFAYESHDKETVVGWGKYYGPMVEKGTKNMSAREHMYPLWDKNKEKYYKKMVSAIGLN